MPTLLLIRHAENDFLQQGRMPGRLPGIHLNDLGRQRAQALANRLAHLPIAAIYSSPLERALETAQAIAAPLSLAVQSRPGLLETDCGDWAGKTLKSLRRLKAWKSVQQTPSAFTFPNGESFAQSQQRVAHELQTLAGLHDDKITIACVSHGDPIRLAAAHFLGVPLDHFQRLIIAPASVTTLQLGGAAPRLLNLNLDLSLLQPPD